MAHRYFSARKRTSKYPEANPEPFGLAAQQLDEFFIATRRAEDHSPLGSVIQNMIPWSWEVHPGCASHENDNAVSRKEHNTYVFGKTKQSHFLDAFVFCIDATLFPIPLLTGGEKFGRSGFEVLHGQNIQV